MNLKERILDALYEGKLTQKEISVKTGASRSRISEILGELEEEGLIVRKKVSNRTLIVSLNEEKLLRVGILKSSEYVPVILALKNLPRDIIHRVRVYDNSLEALRDLITGELDIVASPLISAFFFNLIDENVKPVAGIAKGGSGVLKRNEQGVLGTTPLSKMEIDSRSRKNYRLSYFKNIESMIKSYEEGKIDAVSIWEPYLTKYRGERNNSRNMCCAIITYKDQLFSLKYFMKEYFRAIDSINIIDKKMEGSILLSKIINEDPELIFKSLDSYEFIINIDKEDIMEQIDSMGIPESGKIEEFMRRYNEFSL